MSVPSVREVPGASLGLGCMRLSSVEVSQERATKVVHAALDRGVRLFDTADVYAPDDRQIGHNERLIAYAFASWGGDTRDIWVASKGGLTRPGGRWRPDGRAGALRKACEASLERLGRESLSLYQLHAVDPAVPIERSARALARLVKEGLVERVGLSNVRVHELERTREVVDVYSVQVALHPFDLTAIKSGLVKRCAESGIVVLAHTPLGGPGSGRRLERHPVLADVAKRHGASVHEVVLAWLTSFRSRVHIVPLVGATRLESIRSTVRALELRLETEDLEALDGAFPASRALRRPPGERAQRRAKSSGVSPEVVLLMGYPAAGKTTLAASYVERGYVRLNRDERGGRLADLLVPLEECLARGEHNVVLDNTYASRASRFDVVETARRYGAHVRCVWLDTSIEQAQVNAVRRMVDTHGRLLEPDEMKKRPNDFAPQAQFRYRRELEPPSPDEGFEQVEVVAFERHQATSYEARAVFFDLEMLLAHAEKLPVRRSVLARHAASGYRLISLSYLPGLSDGSLELSSLELRLAEARRTLGLDFEALWCPHRKGPPVCWCRKPYPGLGVLAIERFGLDARRSILVGDDAADRGFAARLGFELVSTEDFFSAASDPTRGSEPER